MAQEISVGGLAKLLREGLPKDALLLDVRTPAENRKAHIEGSLNIPLDELHQRLDELEGYEKIFVYCHSGGRSKVGCQILGSALEGVKVFNVKGGMSEWEEMND